MLLSQKVTDRLGEGKSDSSVWNMVLFLLHNIVIIYSKANKRGGQGVFKGTGNYHSQLKFHPFTTHPHVDGGSGDIF